MSSAERDLRAQLVREVLDAWAERVLHESMLVVRFARDQGEPGRGEE